MAVNAATVWEVRSTGSQNNGGGYFAAGGASTDYSQQDAAQISPADLAHPAGSTTLTSLSSPFTTAMVGNIIHITSGTNFTVGWYEIKTYVDANTVTVDRSLGASANTTNNGVGYVGGAFLIGGALDGTFASAGVAGNIYWIKVGGYSFATNVSFTSGSTGTPMKIYGYNVTRDDKPTGVNRPTLSGGAFTMTFGNSTYVKNIIFTSTATTTVIFTGASCVMTNCSISNTSGTANRDAVYLGNSVLMGCECNSTAGWAIRPGGSPAHIIGCYIHDSLIGINCNVFSDTTILNNVIDTCATGINMVTAALRHKIIGNTIYNSITSAMTLTTSYGHVIYNNIISGCAKGILRASGTTNGFDIDFNCWNNTLDISDSAGLIVKGPNCVTGNPAMADPANGDFSILSNSNSAGVGFDVNTYTPAVV